MNSPDKNIQLFKTIFEQTPISTQIFIPNGTTVLVNKAWEDLWNVKFEQLGNYNILKDQQLVHSGTMPYIKKGFKGEHISIPPIYYDPAKTVPIDGVTPRWLSARMYPIKDEKSKITHLVLQHEDITERKKSEENLKQSQERLRATWESASDAMALSDDQGIVLDANSAYLKLYGYNKNEIIGQPFSIIFPQEHRKSADKQYQQTFHGKLNEAVVEAKVVSKQGEEHMVESRYSFLTNKDIRIAMLSVIRDISEQKKSEVALRESEERLRLALEAGNIGVWDWDIKQNLLTWTDNVYKIHDVDKNNFKLTFNNFKRLIHPEDQKLVLSSIDRTLKKGKPFNIEFRIIDRNQNIRWVSTSAVLIKDKTNTPVRMLGATSEITQQKQIEQDKSDFLSMAAHELKTPITSMKMFVEILQKELQSTSHKKASYYASRIKDQTNRLTELTSELLDVSRIETGKLQLNLEAFDISKLIKDTVESVQGTTKHLLKFKEMPNTSVLADKYRIYQVIVNLLTNAIKYSPVDKTVEISLKKNKRNIEVCIKDQGIGISKQDLSKIFEKLYQVSDSKEKTYPGLGLGLYITKDIIQRHKGKIWVESKKGVGSSFYFTLPLT